MHKETFQEKSFHDKLSPDVHAIADVSFGYQENLRIIQKDLQTFYGERADWRKCLKEYFLSSEYQNYCHYVHICEDMPLLTHADLQKMIHEDKKYQENIKTFLELNQRIIDKGSYQCLDLLFSAADILGISPDQKRESLYQWIIFRKDLDDTERQFSKEKISESANIFSSAIDCFSTLFLPGIQLTFPHIGTSMTQKKNKYFYRGENAYYRSSKPGIYRSNTGIIQLIADHLILNEACLFLDQFDAVKYWNCSGVNYIALAQHYGIKTSLMDLTSDLKTALFFACCKYENGQWRPLEKKDFECKNSRLKPKDARYGVIYRSPTEITDMKWALADGQQGYNLIAPIGYQPFMRCSSQHGYMLCTQNAQYDMMKDPLFDKFRIKLDEDLCQWIFEEMDRGNKVYPNDDIPKMEYYMAKIRSSHMISQKTFDHVVLNHWHYSEQHAAALKQDLQRAGYTISNGQIEHITYNKLQKINRKYSVNIAYSKLDVPPKARPMIILPSDTLVYSIGNGEYGLTPNYDNI